MASIVRAFVFGVTILVVLSQPFIFNAICTFVFAGVLPGTDIELPFWAMSLILAGIGYSAIAWLKKDTIYIGDTIYETQLQKRQAREYVLQKSTIKTNKQTTRRPILKRFKRTFRVAAS